MSSRAASSPLGTTADPRQTHGRGSASPGFELYYPLVRAPCGIQCSFHLETKPTAPLPKVRLARVSSRPKVRLARVSSRQACLGPCLLVWDPACESGVC